jgi:uncharacterized Rmd1/YagE family protein
MNLLSLYLNRPLKSANIEYALDLKLSRGVEGGYYGNNDKYHVVLAPFNVLTLIAHEKHEVLEALKLLNLSLDDDNLITQDYPILINSSLDKPFKVGNDAITLKDSSTHDLNVIALAISQSVGLEHYEKLLDTLFSQSRSIIDSIHTISLSRRAHLMQFASRLALTRHDMVANLVLLDKPNILWDDEEAEMLYNALALALELHDRHGIALSKLSHIKEDVVLVMDIINHKKSEFLEWIIIVLITVEIVMGLIKFFE